MGSGASTKKYQSNAQDAPLVPTSSEEPIIEKNKQIDSETKKAESVHSSVVSVDSMQVNTSRDDILEAVGRVRAEAAIGSLGRLHDLPAPTPPDSPAPTTRNRRSNTGTGPAGGGASPQADFIIDEDSGQFDDESPALNISDINEFLNLQRQQTVSVLKNAELEREVAELEKQLRQMDMMDAGGGGAPQRLPSVEKPTVVSARVILSRERPSSGAAVMPDPTAGATHRDDSYTPSGTSSRQSSRGLVKSALRNANSASALEAASTEHLRQYNHAPGNSRGGPRQELSPPPSPPPPDQSEAPGGNRTRIIELSDSDTNDGPSQGAARARKLDRGENDHDVDNVGSEPKADGEKPVMRFEQRPHNAHHHRHIGHSKRNGSDSNVKKVMSDSNRDGGENTLPAPRGADAGGQGSLALLSKKHKDKDREKNVVVVTRRRRGTVDDKGQGDDKPLLPNTEVKRLLVPVNASAAGPSGGRSHHHGHHHGHPRSGASLSPLNVNVSDEASNLTENDDDSPRRLREKASAQMLAPLPVVPALRGGAEDAASGRIPLLTVSHGKDKGRLLQGVNRRRTRAGADEDGQGNTAAAAYMQAISPREDVETDGAGEKSHAAVQMSETVMLSGSLSSRISNQGAMGAVAASVDSAAAAQSGSAIEAAPPVGSLPQAGVRRRQNRASADNLPSSTKTSGADSRHGVSRKERDSDIGTDGDTPAEKSVSKKRVVVAKRTKRKSFGGSASEDGEASSGPKPNVASGQKSDAGANSGGADVASSASNDAQMRPWSQTMEMRLGEVEFMLRKPITSDDDINQILTDAKDGLAFMDELNSVAKSLNMLRGSLSRWLLPYDNNTRIDEQCSSFRTVVDNMPDYLVGKLTQKQVTYLVTEVNKVRQLVRVKIADDNDLEQARAALESTAMFFQRLVGEAANAQVSPYELFNSKRAS